MRIFRQFELDVIRILSQATLTEAQLTLISQFSGDAIYEHTGSGYFLTISHPELPSDHVTLSTPAILGVAKDIQCGFLVFLGDYELTLECHTWGAVDIPMKFRELAIVIKYVN